MTIRARGFASPLWLLFLLALFGCGGGGGGGGGSRAVAPPPPPVAPPPPVVPDPCIETADHGCISAEEFIRLRDARAADILADPEFSGSSSAPGQWGLGSVNAHQAHAAIAVKHGAETKPGTGVTIGVLDSGVDLTHYELLGAKLTETLLQGLPNEERGDYDLNGYSHGTAVTSVMAAQPNEAGFVGIAHDADFKMFTVPIGFHLARSDPRRGTFDYADAYREVLRSGVDIVNNSYGRSGQFIENHDADDLRAGFGDRIEAIAQRGAANPAIFVWAAGNDHGVSCTRGVDENCSPDSASPTGYAHRATSPNITGGAVARLPELQGHNVVAVALDRDGEIADFSNRCGVAGRWCIAAPGVGVTAAYFGAFAPPSGIFYSISANGTSFAAPMVTGGLALMKQFFRGQLSNRELVARLFATADKSGVYAPDRDDGTSSIYGQGVMDLGAAVSPVEVARVSMGGRVGGGPDIQATRLRTGAAFGDGISRALAGREIAAFDALGAPFWFKASHLAGSAARPSALTRVGRPVSSSREGIGAWRAARGTRMTVGAHARAVRLGAWRFGLHESPANAESSLLNLAQDAATFAFQGRSGLEAATFAAADPRSNEASEVGAYLAWRPPDAPLGVRVGWLREEESVLGSRAEGAFGRLSADNVFAGFEAAAEWGGWRLVLDAEVGLVAPGAAGGVIDGFSQLTTSALSLRASRAWGGDEITFAVSQPPRIETGSARLTLPVGRTRDGAVLRESFSAGLAPSGRQVDLTARWVGRGLFDGELRAEAVVSHNPGHETADLALNLLVGLRKKF